MNKGAKDRPCVVLDNVTQKRWDEIFGKKHSNKVEKGTFVIKDGRLVKADDEAPPENKSPAIHGDRLYTKQWDYGAGRRHKSRTDRREWMKRTGAIEA